MGTQTAQALLLTVTALGAIAIQLFIAHRRNQYSTRGTITNPHFIIAMLMTVYLIDFLLLLRDSLHGDVLTIRNMNPGTPRAVLAGFGIYSYSLAAYSFGTFFAHVLPSHQHTAANRGLKQAESPATSLASALIIVGSLPLLASIIGVAGLDLSRITAERQIFFQTRQLQYFLTSLNLPAAIALLAKRRWHIIDRGLFLLHVLLLTLLGGRGIFFYLVIAGLISLARRGLRLPAISAVFLAPGALLALTVMRYFFRERAAGVSFLQSILGNGGFIASAFNSIEISMSHALATIAAHFPTSLRLAPFESFYAGLIYLVPRDLLTSKPLGASTMFSIAVHPEHWGRYHSETLVSGFGDLYMMFGFWGLLLLIIAGLAFSRIVIRNARNVAPSSVMTTSYLVIFSIVFIRGDIYNLAHYAWGITLFLALRFAFRLVLRELTPPHYAGLERPPA